MLSSIRHTPHIIKMAFIQLILWSCFYYAFSASIPIISRNTGWHMESLFLALTLSFLVWAVFSPIAGRCIDAGLAHKIIPYSIISGAILIALIAITNTAWVAYTCIVLLGVVNAFLLYDPFFALILRNTDDKQQASQSILTVTLIAGMATFVTYPTVIFLAPVIGWRGVFMMLSIAILCTLLLIPKHFFITDSKQASNNTATSPTIRMLPAHVWLCLLIGICFGLIILSHTILIFQLPVILTASDSGQFASALLFLLGPAQVFGRLFFPWLKRCLALEHIGVILMALMLGMAVIIWITKASLLFLSIALIFQGMAYGLNTVLRAMITNHYFPTHILGKAIGTIAMIGILFMALSPSIGGYLLLKFGFNILFACIISFEILAILLLWVVIPRYKKLTCPL